MILHNTFSYSTYYTSRLINENLGVSFSNLLRIIRINKSIELIRSTSLPLEKIAVKTGFKRYRNLYNSFYKIYDMSPIQFKISKQKNDHLVLKLGDHFFYSNNLGIFPESSRFFVALIQIMFNFTINWNYILIYCYIFRIRK